jgi:alcohol dehydrogenase, propanol-preferring
VNAIHLDRIPPFSYDLLYWERSLRSVANFTRRDAREFLDLAAEIPVSATVEEFALERADEALDALREGRIRGSAVLRV